MGSNLYTGGIFVDGFQPLHRRNICRWFQPLHRRNLCRWFQPLHRRNIYAEFKPLHRLNKFPKNGGASPSWTLLFIVQTLVQNRILSIPAEPP
ncbi:hypothetical protein TNCV_672321 [Trichonephila clavipes]|nr:hypothetical protein TNCV_672321 [Trichonephila clavipes]